MNYSVYGDDGVVRYVMTLPEGMPIILGEGEYAIEGTSVPRLDKVVDGILVSAPLQPSKLHTFDPESFTWEMDAVKARQDVLQKRQALLLSSDWTQLPDVPLTTKEYWAAYRQSLRDITEQQGFPITVVWPIQPV